MLFLLITINISAQEYLGMATGNYSGVDGVMLNPAGIVNYHQYLDVRIASAGLSVENNYLFIGAEEYRVRDLFRRKPILPTYTESYPALGYSVDLTGFDHYQNGKTKDLSLSARASGPGFIIINGEIAYGLTVNTRSMISFHDVPESVANLGYIGLGYVPQHNIDYQENKYSGAGMAWMEYGVTLAKILEDQHYNRISAGLTLKYLTGMTGFFIYGDNIDYNLLDRSTLDIQNMNAITGMSLPLDYANNSFPDPSGLFKGNGVSFDLGFTLLYKDKNYHRTDFQRLCQQHYNSYVYRLGISLLDVGFVRFKDNTMAHNYTDVDYLWQNINAYQYYNINHLMGDLSNRFYGNPNVTYSDDVITVFTPAAISVQGDYSFGKDFFLNGTWIHPLMFSRSMLRRPAQIAFVPRYERKEFEIAAPVSLYNYTYPRVGLSVRFYMLTIGTEKLGAFTGLTDFTGMDIYFSLKFSFDKGHCPGTSRRYSCESVRFK